MPHDVALRDIKRIVTIDHTAGAQQIASAALVVLGAELTLSRAAMGNKKALNIQGF